MYALNLAEDGRVLSACVVLPEGNYEDMTVVAELPEGNIYEYRYVNGEYIYDPLHAPEEPETEESESGDSVWDELDAAYQEGVDSV